MSVHGFLAMAFVASLGLTACSADSSGRLSDGFGGTGVSSDGTVQGGAPAATLNGTTPTDPAGTPGTPTLGGNGGTVIGTADDCGEAGDYIYLVNSSTGGTSNELLRFDPLTSTFSSIGRLNCPSSDNPFSMAVSRDGVAWVLYGDGNMFHASTTDASCSATPYNPGQGGFSQFGMGFVSDDPGSSSETLFVGSSAASALGTIDSQSYTVQRVGGLSGSPELTGTGNAELFGFFPGFDTGANPSVRWIDKRNGSELQIYPLDFSAANPGAGGGNPIGNIFGGGGGSFGSTAWAFAFWGGEFYVFYKDSFDNSTNVWKLNPMDGRTQLVVPDSGHYIVGAGVSTCAPVTLI